MKPNDKWLEVVLAEIATECRQVAMGGDRLRHLIRKAPKFILLK